MDLGDIALQPLLNAEGFSVRPLASADDFLRRSPADRTTLDIDLLAETGLQNEATVFQGLMSLPDQAARELKVGDVEEHGVVRVADELLVDLMRSEREVRYPAAVNPTGRGSGT